MKRIHYPFTAIVGQEELLLGIILNIINPQLGGLLIKGVKGSGKSTAVYSMTDVIPEIEVFQNCRFNCDPQQKEYWCEDCRSNNSEKKVITKAVANVSVPLSITEDRLLGNVDVEQLLKEGKHRFIPGVLSKAHRQILYIDEVNLLPDHIVDDILDVAAMGWNRIEREGFSISHPARFLLIGTMNPEEGELRPQILDRFPLSVKVASVADPVLRKEIINRNLAYEKDPAQFKELFQQDTENLKNIIKLARTLLDKVEIKPEFYDIVVKLCADNKVDGHRADIGIIKTAQTHAAFELKNQVELRHILQAAKFVLIHRTREGGLSKPLTTSEIDEYFASLKTEDFSESSTSGEIDKSINLFADGGLIQQEKKS
ncbi:MAG: ATP-binding protein [Candidatus Cloacimonetes bacterium]|nr:ATP-binding protein [Candidatus Cloacimonadota bacterium]